VAVLRSEDHGATWSQPVIISSLQTVGVTHYKNDFNLRVGDAIPNLAIDPVSGQVYAIWQDARFSQGARNGIVLSTSMDGGRNWSAPVQVNQAPSVPAFVPAVAVGRGVVAISYYDLRNDSPGDSQHLVATGWLAQSADHGQTWGESALTQPFDLGASRVGDDYLFLGDYQGLAVTADGFLPFLALANALPTADPTEVEAGPLVP
jgi:Neuraminidase (sialidase)